MKCPIDNVDLVMTERSGIEIDYCPRCRGVWLDRGELDKIIERAAADRIPTTSAQPAPQPFQPPPPPPREPRYEDRGRYEGRRHDDDDDDDDDRRRGKRRRRESFLDDLFDF